MNKSPETDDDRSIRRLLVESGTGESPELLEGLRLLRSFRALPAPAPTGELAAMLIEPPAQPRRRSQRHRGLILSFALAGAMAAGTTGVAANNDLRLATESFCADVIEQVLPQDGSGEPEPPAEPPPAEQLSAGAPAAAADGAAAEPEADLAAEPEDLGAYPVSGDADMPDAGEESPGAEVSAYVEDEPPVEAPLPVPGAEPEPGVPDHGAQDRVKRGSHTITARPGRDNAGEGAGNAGRSGSGPAGTVPARDGFAGGSGHPRDAGAGPRNSAHPSSGHTQSGRSDLRNRRGEQLLVPSAEAPGEETAPGMGGR